MASDYVSRTGGGEYKIIFTTDDWDIYRAVEEYIRAVAIDHRIAPNDGLYRPEGGPT